MRVLFLLVGIAGVALPVSARAFYLESRGDATTPVVYDTATPIQYRIGSLSGTGHDDAEMAAIRAAFQTWQDVECASIAFEEGPREAAPEDPQHWVARPTERYISVYFSNDASFFPMGTARAGFFAFGHDGMGHMFGGTVILNIAQHAWSTTGETDKL